MSRHRRIRVAVIYGGRSSEHGISVLSAASVLAAMDPAKYDVVPVGITPEGGWVITDGDPAQMTIVGRHTPRVSGGTAVVLPADPGAAGLRPIGPGELQAVDVAFPVLHGKFGEDGTVQGLLELAGVPYVGSGVFASAAAMDKDMTKKLLRADGLPIGDYLVTHQGQPVGVAEVAHLGLPLFVKPARAGSSVGITRVTSGEQLPQALATAFAHDEKVLVEAAEVGREVECGVLEDASGAPQASVPAEIRVAGEHGWYDFQAKYLDDGCQFDVPARLPAETTARVQQLAIAAFRALNCAGLARVDFFVRPDGQVIINELNTLPGFTAVSMFPRMWAASGVDYPQLVDRLIAAALRRGAG